MAGLVPGSRGGAENGSIARSVSQRPITPFPLASAGIALQLLSQPAFCTSGVGNSAPGSIPSPAAVSPICPSFHWDAELIICLHPFSRLVPMLPSGVIRKSISLAQASLKYLRVGSGPVWKSLRWVTFDSLN